MKKNYTVQIKGMTCHACSELIRMDLEEAGFTDIADIHHETGIMKIAAEETDLQKLRDVIAATKKYSVSSIS